MEDLHKRWSHRWLTKKAEVINSKIHGLGVSAIQGIQKGEVVGVLGGIIVPSSDIEEYWDILGHVGIQIDDNFFIVPSTREELEERGIFNHSCNPNCGIIDNIKMVAMKEIKEGEELVFDYALTESLMRDMICNCGSENCRKIITKNDWKKPELQEKYKEYFSDYLRKKFKS